MNLTSEDGVAYQLITLEDFASLLNDRHLDVVAHFLGVVKSEVLGARLQSTSFLIDCLPQMMIRMSKFLSSNGSVSARAASVGLARTHAKERLKSPLYTLEQIRAEYTIVQKAVYDLLPKNAVVDKSAASLFTVISDLTLAVVIEEFMRESRPAELS